MDAVASLVLAAFVLVALLFVLRELRQFRDEIRTKHAPHAHAAADWSELDEAIAPSETRALRHEHTHGPKDADGIRHCRCGDRYLDSVRVP